MTGSDQSRQLIIGMSDFHSVSVWPWLFSRLREILKDKNLYEWE